ncbi:DUF1549 domain-containing protein [uncultured Paludibaculum sp.]|uniref:DUF1549 domain-containing protein n=1 Tax=uncultured Paludibaculum sp. TaxID=1765020 RepID=UPI002AABC788|nr:DUF1549 domain-containing protein [uncultured Paludibaculum sp.]
MTALRLYPILMTLVLAAGGGIRLAVAADVPPRAADQPGANCSYIAAPDSVVSQATRVRREIYEQALAFAKAVPQRKTGRKPAAPSQFVRRNLIDQEIFQRLEAGGMLAAPLSGDEEFFRRINLDLTGRIPSAEEMRAFVADRSPRKRDAVIDRLLNSPEFVDKWTMWLGDLLQNSMAATNRSQNQSGRNAFHEYIKSAIADGKSWRAIAYDLITATGNNYDGNGAGVNFLLRGYAPMGPSQDTYDLLTVRAVTIFLGLGHYDCLLCHNGQGHLDAVSAWGTRSLRVEAERMAAHFSRMNLAAYPGNDKADFYKGSNLVLDRTNGDYLLNTKFGNRPDRTPIEVGGKEEKTLTPVYRDGTPAGGNWRVSFALKVTQDPMFARNFVNRLWKAMFNLALAEPVDALDPDRLDPAVEPPGGWDYQASYPDLLEDLAQLARESDFNLREMLRTMAQSTAYQLSSEYDGPWSIAKVSTFARHLPRRLEAEEVHDAVVKATGVSPAYTVGGWAQKVNWAMQLPEPAEPRTDGPARAFLDSFDRGNRDTLPRTASGSVLMWLNLMNSPVVNGRVNAKVSPYLAGLVANPSNEAVVEDLFLTFLSRSPSEYEKTVALRTLANSGTRQYTRAAAVEDLAWALINKADFLFSY